MKRGLFSRGLIVMALGQSLLCSSCSDDTIYGGNNFEEGLPATVSLNVNLSNVQEMTRANNTEDDYISDLYIAIFAGDSQGGKRLFSKYYEDFSDNDEIEYNGSEGVVSLKGLELTSTVGARIVAIANIANENRSYITGIEKYYTKFSYMQNFTFSLTEPTDIYHYGTTFLMTGWYANSESEYSKDITTIGTVDIKPGGNNLPGAIFLHRLSSHNTFRIKAGENVNLKINTWQVHNVPVNSYMFEHEKSVGEYADSYTTAKLAHTFSTEVEGNDTYKTFEFYILENKHTACDYQSLATDANGNPTDWVGVRGTSGLTASELYTDREREYKNADGTNSGIYKSLIESHSEGNDDSENLSNNYASYVVVNADIDYYIEDNETNREDPSNEKAAPVPYDESANQIHRVANINYTIHLGFCQGKDELGNVTTATARDFNCKRNANYTYNVTINGVRNVVVEATSDEEPEPGTDGTVYDAYATNIDLDAHYCEFNIDLTDQERAELVYRMTVPYGDGVPYEFFVDGTSDHPYNSWWENESNPQRELFTWIKFLPAANDSTLTEYNKETVWSIEDLRDLEGHPSPEADADGKKWYTVFVDEYVYHIDDSAEGVEDSWPLYVNKDDRVVELIKSYKISKDTETEYTFCKFVFSQKSIQTYYSTSSGTAIGVEHTDETYGLNITWGGGQSSSHSTSYYSFTDGAHNLWNFAGKRSYKWSNVIDATTVCKIHADSNDLSTVMMQHDAAEYPIYLPHDIGPSTLNLRNYGYPSPSDTRIFYGNGVCFSRNRDLNSDNTIDADEVRWYLPTSSEYMQIAIGQGELPDPLIQFGDLSHNLLKDNSDREGTYRYHFLSSDYQYFWAEQGLSVGDKPYSQALCQAYSVRCIRQLGTSRTAETLNSTDSPVATAYTHDATNRTFTMTNYNESSLRGYSAGALAPHDVSSVTSRPYRKFEYASDLCRNISDDYISIDANGLLSYVDSDLNITSTPSTEKANALLVGRNVAWAKSLRHNGICKKYTQEEDESDLGTWRIPNFKELAFVYMGGLLTTTTNDNFVFSCTYDFFSHKLMYDNETVTSPFFGYNDNSSRKVLARDIAYQSDSPLTTKIRVRCVRDVQ